MQHTIRATLAALLVAATPAAAEATAAEDWPAALPASWAGLEMGMSVAAFDRLACALPECRHGRAMRERVSYVIDAQDARPLELLPGLPTRFVVRWATFFRGRLVGFHATPAGAPTVFEREAVTTALMRRFGQPAEALTTLIWCGSEGAELSFDPAVTWVALRQLRPHGTLEADEAVDSICLIPN